MGLLTEAGAVGFTDSPDAIASFRLREAKEKERKETPLVRISTQELGRLLEQRREYILSTLPQKDAKQNLDNVIGLLSMFDRVTLTHRGEGGQATWTLRLSPARRAN